MEWQKRKGRSVWAAGTVRRNEIIKITVRMPRNRRVRRTKRQIKEAVCIRVIKSDRIKIIRTIEIVRKVEPVKMEAMVLKIGISGMGDHTGRNVILRTEEAIGKAVNIRKENPVKRAVIPETWNLVKTGVKSRRENPISGAETSET